jgi:hypothetical protein
VLKIQALTVGFIIDSIILILVNSIKAYHQKLLFETMELFQRSF